MQKGTNSNAKSINGVAVVEIFHPTPNGIKLTFKKIDPVFLNDILFNKCHLFVSVPKSTSSNVYSHLDTEKCHTRMLHTLGKHSGKMDILTFGHLQRRNFDVKNVPLLNYRWEVKTYSESHHLSVLIWFAVGRVSNPKVIT